MTQSDVYYRALLALEGALRENRAIAAAETAVANAPEKESLVVTHNICRVEEDWVKAIERGLEFIGKAIDEDRQFIRSNGEVQPIEKVRHISRESVQHLSRHSDLITREQKTEDIVPDKLYTVERLNDYTVYENRFLYLLLLRIRDFVTYRYEAIARAHKTYCGELNAKKRVVTATRRLNYELTLADEQDDVLADAADKECLSYLARMEKIQSSVAFYLRTPLMMEVSRVDKIKTKITKTNVLRMDKNFKEAVTLYEFLLAYDREGFSVEKEVRKLDPVSEEIARELALPALISAFLVYERGLGLEEALKEEFEQEEKRRAEREQLALVEAIRELKKRVSETGESMEEYMLALEKRNAALEEDSRKLQEAKKEIEALKGTIEELHRREEELHREIDSLNEANAALVEEGERKEAEHREKIEEMRREQEEAEQKHREELARAEEARREELARAEKQKREEIAKINRDCEAKLREGRAQVALKDKEKAQAVKDLEVAEKEREVLAARLTALRREHGLLTEADDFTTEEGFNALEHEFEVLGLLVRDKWTDVKKILRKEFMGNLRAAMKAKKPERTERYETLREEVGARRKKNAAAQEEEAAAAETAEQTAETAAEAEAAEITEATEPERDVPDGKED